MTQLGFASSLVRCVRLTALADVAITEGERCSRLESGPNDCELHMQQCCNKGAPAL